MRSISFGLSACLFAACGQTAPPAAAYPDPSPTPIVHTVTASAQGLSVNGYLIEASEGVVAIDSALTVSDSVALRARLDALHKPLAAVLLTHGHPDHYNGVSASRRRSRGAHLRDCRREPRDPRLRRRQAGSVATGVR